jgi:hypothetical protein
VNFPNWSGDHSISVAEIVNGQPKTFLNDEWNNPVLPVLILSAFKAEKTIVDDVECCARAPVRPGCERQDRDCDAVDDNRGKDYA